MSAAIGSICSDEQGYTPGFGGFLLGDEQVSLVQLQFQAQQCMSCTFSTHLSITAYITYNSQSPFVLVSTRICRRSYLRLYLGFTQVFQTFLILSLHLDSCVYPSYIQIEQSCTPSIKVKGEGQDILTFEINLVYGFPPLP